MLWFFFVVFVLVLCLVYPMLPVSLDCLFLIALSVPRTFIYVMFLCIVVSNTYWDVSLFCLSSSFVLCTQCGQFLRIFHSWLSLRFSIMFIWKKMCLIYYISSSNPLVFKLQKTFKLVVFSAYIMKVFPETLDAHWIRYLRFNIIITFWLYKQ